MPRLRLGVVGRVRDALTYPNVIATFCLVLLLGGGTAYAAGELGKESVGTKQLKKEAVTPSKLSKAVRTDLAGASGKRGSPLTTLPSGETLRGTYDLRGTEKHLNQAVTFQLPVASMTAAHFPASADPTDCPGTVADPQARPGNFCVYQYLGLNFTTESVFAPEAAENGRAGKFGADIAIENSGIEEARSYGSWAVTAP